MRQTCLSVWIIRKRINIFYVVNENTYIKDVKKKKRKKRVVNCYFFSLFISLFFKFTKDESSLDDRMQEP